MECQKCGKDLAGKEYKMVADWPFCLECFQGLMKKSTKKVEASADTQMQDAAVEGSIKRAKLKCQLCEKEIEDDHYKKVGIWIFCSECHADLISRPKAPPPSQDEEAAEDINQAEDEPVSPNHDRVQVKYMQYVNCRGCGRHIPERGSKDVNGEPYCPDCYYALPEESRLAGRAETEKNNLEKKVLPEVSEVKAGQGCESCGRHVPEETLQMVEGFAICQACLSIDADLAVQLAQARHQKRLQRLKEELGS